MKIIAPMRKPDLFGMGHYGASRGDRKHNGIDYACYPGSNILAPISGGVSKIGYPYGDDISFRYVQITTKDQKNVRVFYVDPDVKIGDLVLADKTMIGKSQELGKRYKGITEHIHLEVKDMRGNYIDPKELKL